MAARPPTSAAGSPAGSRSASPRRCAPSSKPPRPVADAAPAFTIREIRAGRVRGARRGDGAGLRRRPGRRRRLPPATPERGAPSAAASPSSSPSMPTGACSVASPTCPARGAVRRSRSAATRPGSGCSPSIPSAGGRGIGRALARGLHRPGASRWPERRRDPAPGRRGRSPTGSTSRSGSSATRSRDIGIRPGSLAVVVRPRPSTRARVTSEARSSRDLRGDGRPAAAGTRPGLEVLLTQRPSSMAFAADMHVFPGGRVDPGDCGPALVERSATDPADAAAALGGDLEPSVALAAMSPRSASCSRRPASSSPRLATARSRRVRLAGAVRAAWAATRPSPEIAAATSTCGCGPTCCRRSRAG